MKLKKSFEITEEFRDKIISVAYNDASWIDKIIVNRAAAKHLMIREIYLSYRKTASEVKQLREEVCPEELIKMIEAKTILIRKDRSRFLYDLFSIIYNRPVVSLVTTVVLIVSIVIALIVNKPVQYNYSQAEIIKADKEARYALEIVSKVFNQTNSTLHKEVLGEKVGKPIREGIGIVNNLFKGDKNEIN